MNLMILECRGLCPSGRPVTLDLVGNVSTVQYMCSMSHTSELESIDVILEAFSRY